MSAKISPQKQELKKAIRALKLEYARDKLMQKRGENIPSPTRLSFEHGNKENNPQISSHLNSLWSPLKSVDIDYKDKAAGSTTSQTSGNRRYRWICRIKVDPFVEDMNKAMKEIGINFDECESFDLGDEEFDDDDLRALGLDDESLGIQDIMASDYTEPTLASESTKPKNLASERASQGTHNSQGSETTQTASSGSLENLSSRGDKNVGSGGDKNVGSGVDRNVGSGGGNSLDSEITLVSKSALKARRKEGEAQEPTQDATKAEYGDDTSRKRESRKMLLGGSDTSVVAGAIVEGSLQGDKQRQNNAKGVSFHSRLGSRIESVSVTFPSGKIGIKFMGWNIKEVLKDLPADRSGVRPGWRIVNINGVDIDQTTTTPKILELISKGKANENTILFRYRRRGSSRKLFSDSKNTSLSQPSNHNLPRGGKGVFSSAPAATPVPKVFRRRKTMKVIVIGNAKCGKTSVINRFVNGSFDPEYRSTIGCDYHSRDLVRGENRIRLQLWDIAGQDRFIKLTRAYYRNATGVIVVCDVSRPATLMAVKQWKKELDHSLLTDANENGIKVPVILIANKVDLLKTGKTSFLRGAEIQKMSQTMNFDSWYIGSAKEDQNIKEAIAFLVDRMLEERLKREKRGSSSLDGNQTLRLTSANVSSQSCC
ncbi:hypothetical protein AAMO2058_001111500 [Amorphochlora amoebiformis]